MATETGTSDPGGRRRKRLQTQEDAPDGQQNSCWPQKGLQQGHESNRRKEELSNLQQMRNKLEDMQVDTELQDVKVTLVESGARYLNAAKALLQAK